MKTINEFFEYYAEKFASNPMMYEHRDGKYESSTYAEIKQKVY